MKTLMLLILLFFSLYANSQETANILEPELKKWSFSFTLGGGFGGPCKEIEDAMIDSEFNENSPVFWGYGGKSHPHSNNDCSSLIWSIKCYIKPFYSLGINFGNTYLGKTFGYHDQAGYLHIEYSSFSISPFISINLYDNLRIGTGPVLHFARSWKTNGSASEESEDYVITKVGYMIDTGVRIPWRSAFFVEFITQFRKVGQVEIGPFTAETYSGTAELPRTKVNFDHLIFGLGLGLRW